MIKAKYAFVPAPVAVASSTASNSPSSATLDATQTITPSAIASGASAGLVNVAAASDGSLSSGAKGGIAGGVVAGVLALGLAAGLLFWRRRKAAAEPTEKGWYSGEDAVDPSQLPFFIFSSVLQFRLFSFPPSLFPCQVRTHSTPCLLPGRSSGVPPEEVTLQPPLTEPLVLPLLNLTTTERASTRWR
jgi:hypothetical protein